MAKKRKKKGISSMKESLADQVKDVKPAEPKPPRPLVRVEPMIERSVHEVPGVIKDAVNLIQAQKLWPFTICGGPGIGKTCAGLCWLDHIQNVIQNSVGMYWRVSDLVVHLAKAVRGEAYNASGYKETRAGFFRKWSSATACVLDEVGADEIIPGVFEYRKVLQSVLFDAIDSRSSASPRKPLIILSNYSIDDLEEKERITPRIASRMRGGVVMDGFELPDRRLQ